MHNPISTKFMLANSHKNILSHTWMKYDILIAYPFHVEQIRHSFILCFNSFDVESSVFDDRISIMYFWQIVMQHPAIQQQHLAHVFTYTRSHAPVPAVQQTQIRSKRSNSYCMHTHRPSYGNWRKGEKK